MLKYLLSIIIMTIYILNVNGNKFLNQPIREDGKCGKYNGNAGCQTSTYKDSCCSQHGFCGISSLHCNWSGYYANQGIIKECFDESCDENENIKKLKEPLLKIFIMNNLSIIFIGLGIGLIFIIFIIFYINKTRYNTIIDSDKINSII